MVSISISLDVLKSGNGERGLGIRESVGIGESVGGVGSVGSVGSVGGFGMGNE